jgi:hypothetical protein
MYRRTLQTLVLSSLAALVAVPVLALDRIDLGPLHIHISNEAPPRARYERRPARPHRDAIWIRGSWDRQNDHWEWIAGRWERQRDRRHRWINARYTRVGCHWYRRRDCRWRYEPAHWSNQQVIEGEDYQSWRREHGRGQGRNHRQH